MKIERKEWYEKSSGMFSRKVSSMFPRTEGFSELVFLERSQTHVHCCCVDLHRASEQLISHLLMLSSSSAVVIEIYTAAQRRKYISVCSSCFSRSEVQSSY